MLQQVPHSQGSLEVRVGALIYRIKIPECPSAEVAEFQWGGEQPKGKDTWPCQQYGNRLAWSCYEITMSYYYRTLTAHSEAVLNYFAVLFFISSCCTSAGCREKV